MEPAFRPRHVEYKSGFDNPGPETQRPPVYNAEDYAGYLGKYCKLTGLQLYLHTGPAQAGVNILSKIQKLAQNSFKMEKNWLPLAALDVYFEIHDHFISLQNIPHGPG